MRSGAWVRSRCRSACARRPRRRRGSWRPRGCAGSAPRRRAPSAPPAPVLVSHLLCRVLAGSSAVLFERFDLGTVLEAVERHGISDLSLIGGMVFDVVQAGSVPAAVRQTVRKVSVGGAPTPMEAKRA